MLRVNLVADRNWRK